MPEIELSDGTKVQATIMDFDILEESDAQLLVEDGTRMAARLVPTNILRIDAEDNPDGNEPLYRVNTEVHIQTDDIPEHLLAESDEEE